MSVIPCARWALVGQMLLAVSLVACSTAGTGASAAPDNARLWTFSAGLGSIRAWNLVALARDIPLGEHTAMFVTAGLGEMILGGGLVLYEHRDGAGWIASVVAGTGRQAAIAYRVRVGSAHFVALGASYVRVFGFSDIHRPQWLPIAAYERHF